MTAPSPFAARGDHDAIETGSDFAPLFDANGLMAPMTVTAKDHGGGGKTRIEMWDGTKWVPQTDWIAAYTDVVGEVVKKEAAEFAKTAPK